MTDSNNSSNLTRLLAVGGVLLIDKKNRRPTPPQSILGVNAVRTPLSFDIPYPHALTLAKETDFCVRTGIYFLRGTQTRNETGHSLHVDNAAFMTYWHLLNNPHLADEKVLQPYEDGSCMAPAGLDWVCDELAFQNTPIGYSHIPPTAIKPLSAILRQIAKETPQTEEIEWRGLDGAPVLDERLQRRTRWGSQAPGSPYDHTTQHLDAASIRNMTARYNMPWPSLTVHTNEETYVAPRRKVAG